MIRLIGTLNLDESNDESLVSSRYREWKAKIRRASCSRSTVAMISSSCGERDRSVEVEDVASCRVLHRRQMRLALVKFFASQVHVSCWLTTQSGRDVVLSYGSMTWLAVAVRWLLSQRWCRIGLVASYPRCATLRSQAMLATI